MRNLLFGAIVALLAASMALAGESRQSGSSDTSRHPERDRAAGAGGDGRDNDYGKRPLVVVPRPDPAVEYFWSDRCVNQRRYGTSHTKDCDNPAFTGGGTGSYYRYTDPYGYGYRPYRPYVGYGHRPSQAPRGRIDIPR